MFLMRSTGLIEWQQLEQLLLITGATYVVVMREVQGCHWQPLELGPTKSVDSRLLRIPALSPRCHVSIIEGLEPE